MMNENSAKIESKRYPKKYPAQNTASKVVMLDPTHSTRSSLAGPPTRNLVSKCREQVARHIPGFLDNYFEKIDDELFSLSDKAENSTLQSLYFEAMRYIRKQRSSFSSHYQNRLLNHYDEFWHTTKRLENQFNQPALDNNALSLIDKEALEEELAVVTMADKGNNIFQVELFALNKRFAVLKGIDKIDSAENPIAPMAVCRTFEQALSSLILDLNVKLVIYKLFDRFFLSQLGLLYGDMNTQLIDGGILPTIINKARKNPSNRLNRSIGQSDKDKNGVESSDWTAQNGPSVDGMDDEATYHQTFQAIQQMMVNWRSQTNDNYSHSISGSQNAAAVAYNASQVLDALSAMQILNPAPLSDRDLHGKNQGITKHSISECLASSNADDRARPLRAVEEDVIDMVGMVFDFIFDGHHLPDALKALIGRLQIPVVKVAIIDKTFFAKKTHPVRQLLNGFARAGVGLDNDSFLNSPVYELIDHLVHRIISEFEQDMALFSELLDEFTTKIEQDEKRASIIEERTQQTSHSREQLAVSKLQVERAIVSRMQEKAVPEFIKSFLLGSWKDVLLLSHLRKSKISENWIHRLTVTEQLIASVVCPETEDHRKKIIQSIPTLLQNLQSGLEDISFDPYKSTTFFKDLEDCHRSCLSRSKDYTNRYIEGTDKKEEKYEASESTFKDKPGDTEIDCNINEFEGILPDVEQIDLTEILSKDDDMENSNLIQLREEIIMDAYGVAGSVDDISDEFLDRAKSMEIGQWVEFCSPDGKKIKGKLSWKSPITSIFVFVNRRGVKIAEKSLHGFAAELRRETALILEESQVPLLDRALSAMMHTLESK